MIRKVRLNIGHRHGNRIVSPLWISLCATLLISSACDPDPPIDRPDPDKPEAPDGRRQWIGRARSCEAPAQWKAERLFTARVSPEAAELCRYTWVPKGPKDPPYRKHIDELFQRSGARDLTEEVAALTPMAWSAEEVVFYRGLRTSLRTQVGDATLLPVFPARPVARIVVLDTAPDALHGAIAPGVHRHGDTLAHLIEDLVCLPSAGAPTQCAAEITTALAMPRVLGGDPSVQSPTGGTAGTLPDLALAIERAVLRWENDGRATPLTTPPRLILNLSLGWEHTATDAECQPRPISGAQLTPPELAVRAILAYAASKDVLILAAAGNDAGGPAPRAGLTCPGAYQALERSPGRDERPLLFAVSGVDHHDDPLLSARPQGRTAIVALGFGGVAWREGEAVPPSLMGSSVATAVATVVSALAWAQQPSASAYDVGRFVYNGGRDLGPAEQCPTAFGGCHSRRASVCGALHSAGAVSPCTTPAPLQTSSPNAYVPLQALWSWFSSQQATEQGATLSPPTSLVADERAPSIQIQPWTFPAPISATCPTCWGSSSLVPTEHELTIPDVGVYVKHPVLKVHRGGGVPAQKISLGDHLSPGQRYHFTLPAMAPFDAAELTGFDEMETSSITVQLFIEHQ
jgi:hypothetical protein